MAPIGILAASVLLGSAMAGGMAESTVPGNDNFADRYVLTGLTNIVVADNTLASLEPGEPVQPTGNPAGHSLWWTYTAPASGVLQVGASGFSNSVVWIVYKGNSLTELELVAVDVALPTILWTVDEGDTFQIAVDGANWRFGGLTLAVMLSPPPENDAFINSIPLRGTNESIAGTYAGATLEPDEPLPRGPGTVWASWAPLYTGKAICTMERAPAAQYASVFTGPRVDRLQPVFMVGEVGKNFVFLALEGTVYHFQFSGDGILPFNFSVREEPLTLANNDHFAKAAVVNGQVVGLEAKSVLGATMELGEPLHMGAIPQKSLWWQWRVPRHGQLIISSSGSLISNVVFALYQGPAVESLQLLEKGTNQLRTWVTAGELYYFAAAVPVDELGDIAIFARVVWPSSEVHLVPGNLLQEPSWEATALNPQYWGRSGSIAGYVNVQGGCDGTTWPVLGTSAWIWQDFPTVPGHEYRIRFAYRIGGSLSACCGLGGVRVYWGGYDLGRVLIPESEAGYWHWTDLTMRASNTTSRIRFENTFRNIEMDAFSVVDLAASPAIVTQPSSISAVVGGAAAFVVGAYGPAPLGYQWYHNGALLLERTSRALVLDPVTLSHVGRYTAVVSNAFGMATSAAAELIVDASTNVTLRLQPYGGIVPAGSYFNLSVVASGTPRLDYQWYLNGRALAEGTNRNLLFASLDRTNAGIYEVLVRNYSSSAWSLPTTLIVTNPLAGGGWVDFANKLNPGYYPLNNAPVFDVDGLTRLNGTNFVAQLYAGTSDDALRPVGLPTPFRTGFDAGFIESHVLILPNVPPCTNAFAQIRVWEIDRGTSYEEARAIGGKFGRSSILKITTDCNLIPPIHPSPLYGLTSFALEAGLPQFTAGRIQLLERQPQGRIVWSLHGEPGFRYVVEKAEKPDNTAWRPYVVVSNITGIATFSDSAHSASHTTFYRARILD